MSGEPETGWELGADCETAGVIDGKTDLPVRAHPYLAPGMVVAVNRSASGPLEHNCRFEYCTAPTGECPNPE